MGKRSLLNSPTLLKPNGTTVQSAIPDGATSASYLATLHGLKCDGATDDTAALNTLLGAIQTAGVGAEIRFPSPSLLLGRVIVPNDGGTPAKQVPITLTSMAGPNMAGQTQSGVETAGTYLDLRYAGRTDAGCGATAGSAVVTDASITAADNGTLVIASLSNGIPHQAQIISVTPGVSFTMSANAKITGTFSLTIGFGRITSFGLGRLRIHNLGLVSGAATSMPFGQSTYTTVVIHDNKFLGSASKGGVTCDEDPWIFGGTQTIAAHNGTEPFQGYVSRITDNDFCRCRRLLVQTYVAGLDIDRNNWWQDSGSNYAQPTTLAAQITVAGGALTSLSVAALTAPFYSGDTVQIGRGATQITCTMSATAAIGATTLAVNSFTPNATYAIGTITTDITSWAGGCVEVWGTPGQATNISVGKNRFEFSGGYTYGAWGGAYLITSQFGPNDQEDSHANNLAVYRFETTSQYNLVLSGQVASVGISLVDDPGATTTILTSRQSAQSVFPQGISVAGPLSKFTALNAPAIVDSAGNAWQDFIQGSPANQRALSYTPAGGAAEVFWNLVRNSAANHQVLLGGTSTSILGTTGLELNLQSASGSALKMGDPTLPADTKITNGVLQLTHAVAFAGTITAAAANGSTAVSVAGKDMAHKVSLTTAASVAADVAVATMTYGKDWGAQAPGSLPRYALTPKNGASQAAGAFITGDVSTGYSIALHTPPAGATALVFDIVAFGS